MINASFRQFSAAVSTKHDKGPTPLPKRFLIILNPVVTAAAAAAVIIVAIDAVAAAVTAWASGLEFMRPG